MRALFYVLLALIVLTFVRMAAGVITKGIGGMLGQDSAPPETRPDAAPPAPAGGELRRDPMCGTYVPVATSPHKIVAGETVYFCSAECRDKYRA